MKNVSILITISFVLVTLLGCSGQGILETGADEETKTALTDPEIITPSPAEFTVSDLSVTPIEVKPDEDITISTVVTNSGGSEGSYIVILNINSEEESRKEITIEAGKSETVDFSVTRDKDGSYEASIDGEVGQFTVSTPTPAYIPPVPTQPAAPTGPYEGPLFDTHLHLYGSTLSQIFPSGEKLLSFLDKGKVDWALGFYSLPPDISNTGVSSAKTVIKGTNNRVIPLVLPSWAIWQQFASGQYNETVLRKYLQPEGLFEGVGEIHFAKQEMQSVTFDSPQMQTVFQLVNESKGIVMIHPSTVSQGGRATELSEIEPAIRQYPEIIFLFHPGVLAFNMVSPLMAKYPNVYVSFDFMGSMLIGGASTSTFGSAESFIEGINSVGDDRIVEENLNRLVLKMQQYPERIFWGTDLQNPWYFEDSVSDAVIRISRKFIGKLPADIQEKYAYQNAESVFGRFLTPNQ